MPADSFVVSPLRSPESVLTPGVLYESGRTRVTRGATDGEAKSLIFKEALGPDGVGRLQHEREILARLVDVKGVPRLAAIDTSENLIALEDDGCTPLPQGPLEVAQLLDLSLELAEILAAVHRCGVVHKKISPADILLTSPEGRPMLVDFELATTSAEERPGFVHHGEIVGTLAYMAPEQTGRTGRSVDHRSDLYALGATLYELATGRPPFDQDDPLERIHDILARVPTPPIELASQIPSGLSAIIMRLLEKEPDRRYQSGEGLAHDLAMLTEQQGRGIDEPLALGGRDFPLRLAAPSRLIGRDIEIAALKTAFERAQDGGGGVLVTGAPGIGKSALINELRPLVAARGGLFVSGKFDQYRQDLSTDGLAQAMRALGRLLLAEPESSLAELRGRLVDALGNNVGLTAALIPEFALLLGVAPEIPNCDPLELEARAVQTTTAIVGTVASPDRPLVMVLDDLQWAAPTPIAGIDAMLTEGRPDGFMLVSAYRDAEVPATHPLSAMLSRWERLGATPLSLRLENLSVRDLGALLEEMLRLPPAPAAALAEAVSARTGGNPFDTVELINALRRDGALVPGPDGWTWDDATIRRFVGQGDVVELLALRIDRLAPQARALLEIMACLGGEVEFGVLEVASALSATALLEQLAPSLEEGLLVLDNGVGRAVCFRHDRVQQAAYGRLDPDALRSLHLTLARRLSPLPELAPLAAAQYLPAVAEVRDPDERRRVAGLFAGAAAHSRVTNFVASERYLATAIDLLGTGTGEADDPLLAVLETERHAALYSVGRFEEADELYRSIEERCQDPLEQVDSACVQVTSLMARGRPHDAVELGVELLRRLGTAVPEADQMNAEIDLGLDGLYAWVEESGDMADLQRPVVNDPAVLAVVKLINRLVPPSYFSGQPVFAWFVTEGRRIWSEHGPCPALIGILSHASFVMTMLREDYRTGYGAVRRVLALGEARGYEPETSQARFLFSLGSGHWFEPLEDNLRQAQRAREGLVRGGDLLNACFTYYSAIPMLLDCAPAIDTYSAEVESGLAFATRTGNDQAVTSFHAYRQFGRTVRGETRIPGSFTDASFDEAEYVAGLGENATAAVNFHITRALAGLLFGDDSALISHAAAAMPLRMFIPATYGSASAYFLQAMALAARARAAAPEERGALLAELDVCRDWLALRAADVEENLLHLVRMVDAERAWAAGDSSAAGLAFDEALGAVELRRRPWHRALIAERAGVFYLSEGYEYAGRAMLSKARREYEDWGAAGKVSQLDERYDFLAAASTLRKERSVQTSNTESVTADSIDLLAILRGSQALSSETSLERLRVRVAELLCEMTGATAVRFVTWNDDAQDWSVESDADAAPISVEEAGAAGLLPLSAFRYAERTKEPLLVEDATLDDRFAQDPYLAGLERCSLLVVPIQSQGAMRAMLVLENQLASGVFSTDRLDAVGLVAGQLAVSLDNALLYASLEGKVADRTAELAAQNHRLLELDLMKDEFIALVSHELRTPLTSIRGYTDLLLEDEPTDEQRDYLAVVDRNADRLLSLVSDLLLIAQIQSGRLPLDLGQVSLAELVEQAGAAAKPMAAGKQIELAIAAGTDLVIHADRARLAQVIDNLLSNALKFTPTGGQVSLSIALDGGTAVIEVSDSGIGIPKAEQAQMFGRFFRSSSARAAAIPGTGLGLVVTQGIVEAHGGTIGFESTEGIGTTFRIVIPVTAPADLELAA